MKLPAHIKHPDAIRAALAAHTAKTEAPGYVVTQADLANLIRLNQQYADFLKYVGEHPEAING